jgi:hypothetical protein
MDRTSLVRTLRIWYRFTRRRTRGLRRLCITILSVALVIDRVIGLTTKFLPGSAC